MVNDQKKNKSETARNTIEASSSCHIETTSSLDTEVHRVSHWNEQAWENLKTDKPRGINRCSTELCPR